MATSTDEAGRPPRPISPSEAQSLDAEQQIEELLANRSPEELAEWGLRPGQNPESIPSQFRLRLRQFWLMGRLRKDVEQYYLNLRRGDSKNFPDPKGGKSLIHNILKEDAARRKTGREGRWKPGRPLGSGGYGSVILWEKQRRNGPPLVVATKDAEMRRTFFGDYCSEAQTTRRLNDVGCKNVISVLDWACIRPDPKRDAFFRIAYEYCEHGDLLQLYLFYRKHGLIFPEAFIWHIFYSIVNALCYCRYGTNAPNPHRAIQGWDQIVHADLKPENMFLAAPDDAETALYPSLKLADFGLAYTLGGPMASVQSFKSTFKYGTPMYMAPEIDSTKPERANRTIEPHELHGGHSDIWAFGTTMYFFYELADLHLPRVTWLRRTIGDYDYYSPLLAHLVKLCREPLPAHRPEIHSLFLQVKGPMALHRAHAYVEEARAQGGVYHSQVLWSKKQQARFENDAAFQDAYRRANLGKLWEKFRMMPTSAAPGTAPAAVPVPERQQRGGDAVGAVLFDAGEVAGGTGGGGGLNGAWGGMAPVRQLPPPARQLPPPAAPPSKPALIPRPIPQQQPQQPRRAAPAAHPIVPQGPRAAMLPRAGVRARQQRQLPQQAQLRPLVLPQQEQERQRRMGKGGRREEERKGRRERQGSRWGRLWERVPRWMR